MNLLTKVVVLCRILHFVLNKTLLICDGLRLHRDNTAPFLFQSFFGSKFSFFSFSLTYFIPFVSVNGFIILFSSTVVSVVRCSSFHLLSVTLLLPFSLSHTHTNGPIEFIPM